jgi:radical SAM protein with 4Fe4S-binding SPASM domain
MTLPIDYGIESFMVQFDRIYIEISNICNLQCSFCPEVVRSKKILSSSDFKIIIQKIKPYTKTICLHLMGEPLAHPEFASILKIAESEGMKIVLTTNGVFLAKHQDILLNSPAIQQINISIQAYLDNFPSGNWQKFIEGVLEFCDLSRIQAQAPFINLRLWNLGIENKNHIVFEMIKERYGISLNPNVDPSFNKSKKIIDKVYLHFDSRFTWPSLNLPPISEVGTCHGLIKQLGILTEGTVVPCCLDKEGIINLGNIFENNLEEILSSPKSLAIIQGFGEGKMTESMCQKCPYAQRFHKKAVKLRQQKTLPKVPMKQPL